MPAQRADRTMLRMGMERAQGETWVNGVGLSIQGPGVPHGVVLNGAFALLHPIML